jgi:hypothetical protein
VRDGIGDAADALSEMTRDERRVRANRVSECGEALVQMAMILNEELTTAARGEGEVE